MRAAASSIASGSPSSRRQISATAAAFVVGEGEVRRRPPRARSTKSATAVGARPSAATPASLADRAAPAAARRTRARPQRRRSGPAGDEHLQAGAGGQEVGDERRRVDDLLEVVEHEQELPSRRAAAEPRHRAGRAGSRATPSACGDRRARGPGRGPAARATKPTPSAKSAARSLRDPQRQAGLADAAGAGQRHQAHARAAQQGADSGELALAADEWSERPGERRGGGDAPDGPQGQHVRCGNESGLRGRGGAAGSAGPVAVERRGRLAGGGGIGCRVVARRRRLSGVRAATRPFVHAGSIDDGNRTCKGGVGRRLPTPYGLLRPTCSTPQMCLVDEVVKRSVIQQHDRLAVGNFPAGDHPQCLLKGQLENLDLLTVCRHPAAGTYP